MQSYKDSLENLLKFTPKWELRQRVSLESALNRVLACDIRASFNFPCKETAAMDGYACRASDLENGNLILKGILPAGSEPNIKISKNECVKTFTGSLMSEGSDTLIPVENITQEGEKIIINKKVPRGFAVRQIGESYKENELLLAKNSMLGFSEIALLAELGLSYVDVLARPKIGVLSTGSEILDLGENKSNNAQIFSSNNIAISSLLKNLPCEVLMMPIIKDEPNLLENSIKTALKSCDILVTTGGVSVGDFDFMRDFAREHELLVDKAAIKPGRHIKVIKIDSKFVFALPGFSYSSMVTALLYLREFIIKMLNLDLNFRFKAILEDDYAKKSNFEEFSAAQIRNDEGVIKISTKNKIKGSSAITRNLNRNSVLLICPKEKTNGLKKGEVVEYLALSYP